MDKLRINSRLDVLLKILISLFFHKKKNIKNNTSRVVLIGEAKIGDAVLTGDAILFLVNKYIHEGKEIVVVCNNVVSNIYEMILPKEVTYVILDLRKSKISSFFKAISSIKKEGVGKCIVYMPGRLSLYMAYAINADFNVGIIWESTRDLLKQIEKKVLSAI